MLAGPAAFRKSRSTQPQEVVMFSKPPMAGALIAVLVLLRPLSTPAADFFVPTFATPTIQDAVDDAAGNADPENAIYLRVSPLFENVTIGGEFNSGHRLTILPDGGVGLKRASVVAAAQNIPVFFLSGAIGSDNGYVTIQDLDILRTGSGNASHLVQVVGMRNVTIERCRIGLNWTTSALTSSSNLQIQYPTEVLVRNCILFSRVAGAFAHAIDVVNMFDPANSILLYNNLAADYRLSGIRVDDGASSASAIVLLRNNIAVNHMAIAPEPFGYESLVNEATIVSSHNVVFATPGNEETLGGGAGSIGNGPASGISMPKPAAVLSFVTMTWNLAPPWDANPTFFKLNPVGLLHDAPSDYGQNLLVDGVPDPNDVANLLDIERQGRPGGLPAHTDRGPDQSDPAAATGVETAAITGTGVLRAAPERNPSRDLAVAYACERAGRITLELFDLGGRRLAHETRTANAGEHAVWRPTALATTALVFYRATLCTEDGGVHVSKGKAVAVQ
jgi:hypothetical protein